MTFGGYIEEMLTGNMVERVWFEDGEIFILVNGIKAVLPTESYDRITEEFARLKRNEKDIGDIENALII